jgi:hypothetical protein
MNSKDIRKARLKKIAADKKDQSGFFSHFNTEIEEGNRQKELRDFSESPSREDLYGLQFNQEDSEVGYELTKTPLSTRYVPGDTRQARRIGNGVVQDPITNEIFDYNETFEHDGQVYGGGSVAMQSSIMYLTTNLKRMGHVKHAKRINTLLHKLSLIK